MIALGEAVEDGDIPEVGDDLEIPPIILEQDIDIDGNEGRYGETALMIASRLGHMQIACALLEHNASVDIQDNYGWTALANAANNDHLEIAQLLLQRNASVNICNRDGWAALSLASFNGYRDIVQLLLHNNAHVDAQDMTGNTALIWAAEKGYMDVAHLLLRHDASVDIENWDGRTATIVASIHGHMMIVDLIGVIRGFSFASLLFLIQKKLMLKSSSGTEDRNDDYKYVHDRECGEIERQEHSGEDVEVAEGNWLARIPANRSFLLIPHDITGIIAKYL